MTAGMSEAASATLTFVERFNQLEMSLYDRHRDQLGDALADGDVESRLAAVPAGDHQFAP